MHPGLEQISTNLLNNVDVQMTPFPTYLPCQNHCLVCSHAFFFFSNSAIHGVLGECVAGNIGCNDTPRDGILMLPAYGARDSREPEGGHIHLHL